MKLKELCLYFLKVIFLLSLLKRRNGMTEFSLSYCRKGSSGSFRSREVGRGFLLLANAVAKDLPRDLLPDQNTAKVSE